MQPILLYQLSKTKQILRLFINTNYYYINNK